MSVRVNRMVFIQWDCLAGQNGLGVSGRATRRGQSSPGMHALQVGDGADAFPDELPQRLHGGNLTDRYWRR